MYYNSYLPSYILFGDYYCAFLSTISHMPLLFGTSVVIPRSIFNSPFYFISGALPNSSLCILTTFATLFYLLSRFTRHQFRLPNFPHFCLFLLYLLPALSMTLTQLSLSWTAQLLSVHSVSS